MPKFRATGSFMIEVEAEDSDTAYDMIQEVKVKDFIWDNYHVVDEDDRDF